MSLFYFLIISGTLGRISLSVSHINHPPTIDSLYPDKKFDVIPKAADAGPQNFLISSLTFKDVDVDSITFSVTSLPANGVLFLSSDSTKPTDLLRISANTPYPFVTGKNALFFQPSVCTSTSTSTGSMSVTVQDQPGATTSFALQINVQCGQLPLKYLFLDINSASLYTFGIGYNIFGLSIATVALVFNIMNRKHPVVKASSYAVNSITLLGTMLIFVSMYFFGLTASSIPECKENIEDGTLFTDLNCQGDNQGCCNKVGFSICQPKIAIFAYGWVMAFGSIFAKTYRVAKVRLNVNSS
jgi:hypothetical protein